MFYSIEMFFLQLAQINRISVIIPIRSSWNYNSRYLRAVHQRPHLSGNVCIYVNAKKKKVKKCLVKLSVLLQGYYMLEFFLLTVCNVLAGRFWQVLGIKIWLTTSWTNRIYFDMEWKWEQSMGCSKAEDNMGGEGVCLSV